MRALLDWLEERTGWGSLARRALQEPVPGGASFHYVWGSVLLLLLGLQALTGVLLGLHYSPSTTDAWASVAFIQDQVPLGWLVRGLHAHGASAMVLVCLAHLMQTAIYGAYRKPREVNWILGVLLFCAVLAFGLTGYLLPWDQTGYWATRVATGLIGALPVAGRPLQQIVQGGNEYGNLTLTRFYGVHVFVLPALVVVLVLAHVALFRRHGVTPRWGRGEEQLRRRSEPFWPHQLFRDTVAGAATLAVLVAVTLFTHGADLEAPANPASSFDARPEWYFRPLFQLLKMAGPLESLVSLVVPLLVVGGLLVLPFLDRARSRAPQRRLRPLGALGLGIALAGGLVALSFYEDATDEELQARLARAEETAQRARRLAVENGVPTAGGDAVFDTEPAVAGERLFRQYCAGCHRGDERKGPEISPGYSSRTWIEDFLRRPSGHRFFGVTGIDDMRPPRLRPPDRAALVELIYSQTGAEDANDELVERGRLLFGRGRCPECHSLDWTTEGDLGPNLARRGSVEMLVEFIADPGHPRWFGEANEMPSFRDKLSPEQRRQLAAYIVSLRDGEWE